MDYNGIQRDISMMGLGSLTDLASRCLALGRQGGSQPSWAGRGPFSLEPRGPPGAIVQRRSMPWQLLECCTQQAAQYTVAELAISINRFYPLHVVSLNVLTNNTDSIRLIVYNLLVYCFTAEKNPVGAQISAS